MDALPVTEEVESPFASRVRRSTNGQDVGVMHGLWATIRHVRNAYGCREGLAGNAQRSCREVVHLPAAEEGAPAGELAALR